MIKKNCLVTGLMLSSTIISIVSSTLIVRADSINTNIIAGSKETTADPTVAHSTLIESASNISDSSTNQAIIQDSQQYASPEEQQAFLNQMVPIAQQVAKQYNIFPSVMLAQAITEGGWGNSLLTKETHNLFGMKGSYNGAYTTWKTQEWSSSKGYYYIYANFRKYDSYYDSFADNANKIRNGVSWNSNYYQGAWRENCSSYKDATAWLQGRYATSPHYAKSLNRVIEENHLDQYDNDTQLTNASSNNDASIADNQVVNGTFTPVKGIATVKSDNYARLFTNAFESKLISNRALGGNTSWIVSAQVVTPSGNTFYKVATTEYVNAKDVIFV